MGLFDKLVNEGLSALNDVVSEENKEKAASFLNDLNEAVSGFAESIQKEPETVQQPVHSDTYYEDDGRDVREKILEVLAAEFPDVTIRENVSPRELGGQGKFMDYSMLLSRNGAIVLAIMLAGKTTTSHREYRWSKEFAEANSITMINFLRHYPNSVEYISDRLHNYL